MFIDGVIGTICLAITSARGSGIYDMSHKGFWMIWLAGLCAYINFLLTNYCLEFGLAGVAISIINTSAAIQVALSSIFLHQLISTGQIIGIILALIGATILALGDMITDFYYSNKKK